MAKVQTAGYWLLIALPVWWIKYVMHLYMALLFNGTNLFDIGAFLIYCRSVSGMIHVWNDYRTGERCVLLCHLQMEPDGKMIACKDKPLLREEDDILNSHRSIFICKAEWRAVTGNHKVPDSWKQLKGFSVCTAWLITSMHTLACASGQPRFIPLLFNRALGFFFFFSPTPR